MSSHKRGAKINKVHPKISNAGWRDVVRLPFDERAGTREFLLTHSNDKMGKKKDEHSMAKRLQENVTMANLPVLPPYPVGSFQTFASTIESTNIFPVRSIESGSPRATDQSQHAIDGKFRIFARIVRI